MPQFEFDRAGYPTGPGCYLMRDAAGKVLYVGKAKNVRRRLASHFEATPLSGRWARLHAALAKIELILVNNETEALILEHNLIKLHQPPVNRVGLDVDEGYFYIALTAEDLPRLVAYRKHRTNKDLQRGGVEARVARCFGPYVNRRFRDALLGFVTDDFHLRTCAPLARQVCLRFHLGACGGVCEQRIAGEDYARAVARAARFLSRPHADLIRHMQRQMEEAAEQLRFERASRIKQSIELLRGALQPQIVEREVGHDQDVLHFDSGGVLILHIRRGAVTSCTLCDLAGASADTFLLERYVTGCPAELIVNDVGDARRLEQSLAAATDHRVSITLTHSGRTTGDRLMRLCALNHAFRRARE